jgi:hypothetical protein
MISFASSDQAELAFAKADSVALDNGAWSLFTSGQGRIDVAKYTEWVKTWHRHPAFDWCIIPDTIDGSQEENNDLIDRWELDNAISVPVWHMHESLEKLDWLSDEFPRVAIGSSGEYVSIATPKWWGRIAEAMDVACDSEGRPRAKLHGLRQMDPEVFSVVPYASVDSTNLARNIGIDSKWTGSYIPRRKETRAAILRDNINNHASSYRWPGYIPRNMELFG